MPRIFKITDLIEKNTKIYMKNFTEVTEIPGQRASKDQMSYMMTRYHLAKKYSNGKECILSQGKYSLFTIKPHAS